MPHWLSLQSISSNLLEAFAALNSNNSNNDASSNTAVASGRGAGTDGANYSASEVVVNSANNISNSLTMIAPGTVTYLQETSLYAARQGFYIIGGAFIQGFNVLFENLNPVLENFVESLLDTSAHPIVRAARTGTVLSSSNGTTGGAVGDSAVAEVDVEQPREATRSSAPRSARTSSRSSASAAYIASASASASAPTSARSPAQPSRSRRTSGASSSRANVLSSRSAPRPELPPPSAPAHRDAVGERLVQTAAQPCVSSPFPATPVLAPAPAASVVSSKASHSDMMAMPPAPPAAILSSEKKEFATEYTAAPTPAASSQSLGQSQSLEISVDTSISSTLPPLPPPASEVVAVPGTIEVAGVGNWTNDAQSKPETLSNAVPPSAQQADAVSESADDRRRSDLSIAETSAIMHSSGLPLSPSVSSAAAAVEQAQSEEVPDGSNEDVLESAQENEKEDNSALAIPAAPAPSTTDASLEEEDVVDESTQADEAVEARSECQLGAQQESQNFSFTSLDLVGEDL